MNGHPSLSLEITNRIRSPRNPNTWMPPNPLTMDLRRRVAYTWMPPKF